MKANKKRKWRVGIVASNAGIEVMAGEKARMDDVGVKGRHKKGAGSEFDLMGLVPLLSEYRSGRLSLPTVPRVNLKLAPSRFFLPVCR